MKKVTFACSDEFEKVLTEIAEKAHESRSSVILKMLQPMAEALEATGHVGIYEFSLIVEQLKKLMLSTIRAGQKRS